MEAHKYEASLAFLTGGGEVGALLRSGNWASSPLGPPHYWPPSLCIATSLMLNSKFPMFLAWGPELCLLYNDAYAEILGAKHPSALGRGFEETWAEIWGDINPLIRRALKGEASYHENLPLKIRRRGYEEQAWFTFSYSPVRDENGLVAGMFCTCTETTAQVLMERNRVRENERLRNLFEQAPSVMAVLHGPQHVFELVNQAYQQMVGNRDVVGKPVREAFPDLEGQGFFELLDYVYATGEPFVGKGMPVRIRRLPDGPMEEFFIDFVYQPIRDDSGSVTGIFANGFDVTEHKHAVNALQTLDRRKDEFLAMLAHELRNPLAPISNAAQLVRLKRADQKVISHASEVISRQVEHLTDLVNDLLDVSRVTRGLITLEQEPLDINVIVTSAVEQVRPLIEKRQHQLIVQTAGKPVYIQGDYTRLVQVISNILNNAAKYTLIGGQIMLQVRPAGDEVEVSIQDNGIGMSAEILPYVFDLFTQADRTPDRALGGLGLGLALVKRIVELHGGSVSAESEGPDKGSKFLVRMPVLPASAHPSVLVREPTTFLEPTPDTSRIMVVDDNVDAAETIALLLREKGYSVLVEHDGQGALERARLDRPQIILLDIGLPDMDGYSLAQHIRSMPETADATLIAITGYGQSGDYEKSRLAGIDHHLVKPVHLPQLAAILGQAKASSV